MFSLPRLSRSDVKQIGAALSAGLLTALLVTPSIALAAPLFTALVMGCDSPDIRFSPVPVNVQTSCSANSSVVGTAAANASANFGSVGARSNSATSSGTDVPMQITALAQFSDRLTFSKTNPNAPDQFPVSLNLALDGVVNSAAVFGLASAAVDIIISFIATDFLTITHSGTGEFDVVSGPHILGGINNIAPGAGGFSTVLTTSTRLASVGDVFFELYLSTRTFASNVGSSATADFGHTLGFPTGIDVFSLPDGYTVNAGNYLVNNRFIDPNAPPPPNGVPEPSTFALLGLGLLSAAGFRRRRRPKQV